VILVTCANGNQGKLLLPKLLAAGHRLRACVHSEASAKQLRAQGVDDVLVGDLADPGFVAKAMHGVASVYHIGPTLHAAERAIGLMMIDAARAEGVGHFVFSSVLHAITSDLIQHKIKRDLEEYLLSSGLEFTVLQPSNYMLPHRMKSVFEEGVFRLSWSLDRYQSMVDLGDVTDVVALVLGQPEKHAAATYELVGPGRYTAHDIGQVLSQVLGRTIGVEQIDPEVFVRARWGNLDPEGLAHQLRMSGAISARYSSHDFLGNPNVLTWLLGRAPTSFQAFVQGQYAGYLASA
jgi:uncharacterized protein YbjT (DUF2867 family)